MFQTRSGVPNAGADAARRDSRDPRGYRLVGIDVMHQLAGYRECLGRFCDVHLPCIEPVQRLADGAQTVPDD